MLTKLWNWVYNGHPLAVTPFIFAVFLVVALIAGLFRPDRPRGGESEKVQEIELATGFVTVRSRTHGFQSEAMLDLFVDRMFSGEKDSADALFSRLEANGEAAWIPARSGYEEVGSSNAAFGPVKIRRPGSTESWWIVSR